MIVLLLLLSIISQPAWLVFWIYVDNCKTAELHFKA